MSKLTITEALAEIKTINKRLVKKRQFVLNYLMRQEQMKDPLGATGGSERAIEREWQAITDLEARIIRIRYAIRQANEQTEVTVGIVTRSIADWLVWRREVAPAIQVFLVQMSNSIKQVRADAQRKGLAVVTTGDIATKPTDVLVNVDERVLAEQIEQLEETLGNLDGQLSLKNATVFVEL